MTLGDKGESWNLKSRTKNGFVESFAANNLNELSSVTNSGTLTVGGTVSSNSLHTCYANEHSTALE